MFFIRRRILSISGTLLLAHQNQNQAQAQHQQQQQKKTREFKQVAAFEQKKEKIQIQEKEKEKEKEQKQEKKKNFEKKQEQKFAFEQKKIQDLKIDDVQFVFALDYTGSSQWLHNLTSQSPYLKMIDVFSQVLQNVPGVRDFASFYFGTFRDQVTYLCRPKWCSSFSTLRKYYLNSLDKVGGGESQAYTSIQEAMNICTERKKYTILLLITDGDLGRQFDTYEIIQKSQNLPLSIIFVVVGGGSLADVEPYAKFDNVGIIDHSSIEKSGKDVEKEMAKEYVRIIEKHNKWRHSRLQLLKK